MEQQLGREDEIKNPKLILYNMLNALKFFYSFKSLESLLGVPAQTLWRYTVLRATPEKETAQRLLARIRELKLVEKVLQEAASYGEEPWRLIHNPGLLQLAALKVLEELGRVDAIVSAPDPYSAALASAIALLIRSRLCIAAPICGREKPLVETYCGPSGELRAIALPRQCLQRRARVAIAALGHEPGPLRALLFLAKRAGAEVRAVITLLPLEEGWSDDMLPAGTKRISLLANKNTR